LSVVIDPSGAFAYVANENSADVSVYALNATTGALTQVGGSPFAAGAGSRSIAID
jgi:6-phosphogluconolactonase (cycloisomerase 2 family)